MQLFDKILEILAVSLFALFLTSLAISDANAGAYDGPFLTQPDTQLHIATSTFMAHGIYYYGNMGGRHMTKTEAVLITLGIGLVKELADTHNSNKEHREDMLANAIGAGSLYLTYSFKF